MFTTFEGDNHVLLQFVAKGLLTDYASEFSDLDPLGMVRVRRRAGGRDTVVERTRVHQLLERIKDVFPGDDNGTRTPGCSTRSTSWRCTASARST